MCSSDLASTGTFPYKGGEQDRSTWIWQLASLGRGDPDKFEAGLVFDMSVAGHKSLDGWRVYVNGRENVELPQGAVTTWRLSVIPGEQGTVTIDVVNNADVIDSISVVVKDNNNVTASDTLDIAIKDTAPVAKDDSNSILENTASVTGQVVLGDAKGGVADQNSADTVA